MGLVLAAAPASGQELKLDWRGFIQTDVRVQIAEEVPFERLETTFNGHISARFGQHVGGVADLDIIWTEYANPQDFAGLIDRQALDPVRFESDALFVELRDLGIDGLDMRLGRQQLIWGAADRFHPTSNANPLDVEDPLAFGDTIANEMIVMRFQPYVWLGDEDEPWFDELSLELFFAPLFKPAQLPNSAGLAFTDPDEQIRLATTPALKHLAGQQKGYLDAGATVAYDVAVPMPEVTGRNTMYGARLAWNLLGFDMSVSYFRGFDDFPRAETAIVTGDATDVRTDLTLSYPRVHVLGVDLATSLPWADGIGLWGEVGITFHDDLYVVIDGTRFAGNAEGNVFPNGPQLEHGAGHFVKAAAGLDYTPVPWWYINIQYLHGFVDEFGEQNLDDYLVGGMDFKLFHDKLVLRTFAILNFQDLSWVLFPQAIIKPFSAAEISVGAFFFFGDDDTKFGSPVAGESTVFAKAKFSF